MEWIRDAAIIGIILYVAYLASKWPSAIDRYIRTLAVDYKRWANLDDEYQRGIWEVREKERFEEPAAFLKRKRRARAMEMGRERDTNAFRGLDLEQTERIEAKFRAELDELDAEIKQRASDPVR